MSASATSDERRATSIRLPDFLHCNARAFTDREGVSVTRRGCGIESPVIGPELVAPSNDRPHMKPGYGPLPATCRSDTNSPPYPPVSVTTKSSVLTPDLRLPTLNAWGCV